jgi:hypothetical protein
MGQRPAFVPLQNESATRSQSEGSGISWQGVGVGSLVGLAEGGDEGVAVGEALGRIVGSADGVAEGAAVGEALG